MSGKWVFVLLALCLAQGFAANVKPVNILDDILAEVENLIQKAKELWEELKNIIATNGAEIIEKIENTINKIIGDAANILANAGECGAAELPKLKQFGEDAVNAVKTCVISEIPDIIQLSKELGTEIPKVVALVTEITAKIAACGQNILCLGELAITEVPKVKAEIEALTPIVEHAISAVEKLGACAGPQIENLENQISEIIDDVEKCLNG